MLEDLPKPSNFATPAAKRTKDYSPQPALSLPKGRSRGYRGEGRQSTRGAKDTKGMPYDGEVRKE